MPIYNHADTIQEALESVLMQSSTYSSVIYCIDDCSTDGTSEILASYSAKYPNKVRVYTSRINQGYGMKALHYNNVNISGRYWCFLEGDDYWTCKTKIETQLAFLESHFDYVGCSSNTIIQNEVTGEANIISPDYNDWNLLDLLLFKNKYQFYVHTSGIVWRNIYGPSSLFLPPVYLKNFERGDVALMYSMLLYGGKFHNLDETMSCYRFSGKGAWSSLTTDEQEKSNRIYTKKIDEIIPLKTKLLVKFYNQFNLKKKCFNLPSPINF